MTKKGVAVGHFGRRVIENLANHKRPDISRRRTPMCSAFLLILEDERTNRQTTKPSTSLARIVHVSTTIRINPT